MAERPLPCCERCYYCNMSLARRHEHDHFPIPKASGGEDVVAACINCHDLKDRMSFEQWNPLFAAEGLQELIGDQVLCGAPLSALLEHVGDYRAIWPRLSPAARLFYAKVRSAIEHDKTLFPSTLF